MRAPLAYAAALGKTRERVHDDQIDTLRENLGRFCIFDKILWDNPKATTLKD
jgi:hypothetical protein